MSSDEQIDVEDHDLGSKQELANLFSKYERHKIQFTEGHSYYNSVSISIIANTTFSTNNPCRCKSNTFFISPSFQSPK